MKAKVREKKSQYAAISMLKQISLHLATFWTVDGSNTHVDHRIWTARIL